jgi:hypothetical protein
MLKFELTEHGNYAIQTPEVFISFVPRVSDISNVFSDILGSLGISIDSNAGKPETAIRINDVWYIFSGDFRKEFEEAVNKGP